MRIQQSPGGVLTWRLFQLLTLAAMAWVGWRLLGESSYRIDIDVYRMGGRAWLDGTPLYADSTEFQTQAGIDLPFTYPPLSAVAFAPFAWLSLPAASAAITVTTLVLLVVSTTIVLTRLQVGDTWQHRAWLAAALTAPAVVFCEPLRANLEFGQINVVLMTLVVADCVPRRTPWPRGVLLGIAIAVKLTPAVFLLYFLLRRDIRALLVTTASAVLATLLGFVLAWRDSWVYWFETLRDTERIGTATLNTNQNISGMLARLGAGEDARFVLWVVLCFAVLGLTVWAGLRALRSADAEPVAAPVLALICVAMFGLVVSPVSWSHHWVWVLPTVVVTAVIGYRCRSAALLALSAAGVALTVWTPITLMPAHDETSVSLWLRLVGGSYLWWALAVIVVIGVVTPRLAVRVPVDARVATGG